MKIKRNKKLKNLLNSNKNHRIGDKIKICFACRATISEKDTLLCPNCKTNLINKNNINKYIKNKED